MVLDVNCASQTYTNLQNIESKNLTAISQSIKEKIEEEKRIEEERNEEAKRVESLLFFLLILFSFKILLIIVFFVIELLNFCFLKPIKFLYNKFIDSNNE